MIYTNVSRYCNNILFRGIENGKPIIKKVQFEPKLYLRSDKPTEWKDIFGNSVKQMSFESIYEMNEFQKLYKDVEGFEIHGSIDAKYQFIHELFGKKPVEFDVNQISIQSIDIEVKKPSEGGFPTPSLANGEINLITLFDKASKKGITWGTRDYKPTMKHEYDIKFVRCRDERDLLSQFIHHWSTHYPDIVTGWNVDGFDIPYLINRIKKIFNDNTVEKLSPFGRITSQNTKDDFNNEVEIFDIIGISVLDYLYLYKKFGMTTQESYTLGHVTSQELGTTKLEYEGTFEDFYTGAYEYKELPETPNEFQRESHKRYLIKLEMERRGIKL